MRVRACLNFDTGYQTQAKASFKRSDAHRKKRVLKVLYKKEPLTLYTDYTGIKITK